jgi:hypothetical protein
MYIYNIYIYINIYIFIYIYICIKAAVLWFELWQVLARHVLFYLSHNVRLFPPVILIRFLFFAWIGLDYHPPIYALHHSWDDRCAPIYWLRWDLTNSLPGLALDLNPQISASQVSSISDVSHWWIPR